MIRIARHGETTWNVEGRYQGRLQSPLSPLGERQGEALAAYFAARKRAGEPLPTRVISSPLVRCSATAAYSARELGLEVELDPRLTEIAHGTWEGRLRGDLEREDPQTYKTWREDPANVGFDGGETLADVLARWRDAAADLAQATEDILVCTHDAVIRVALCDVGGRPLEDFWKVHVENAAFASMRTENGKLVLIEECSTAHLAGLRASTDGQAL